MAQERLACPWCAETGFLFISTKLVAKPLGTWSLAGGQWKTVASDVPVLVCGACQTETDGEVDGGDVHFETDGETIALTDGQLSLRDACSLKEV